MIDWKYNPENYNAEGNQLVPPGQYRVRIEEADERVSRTGKDMIRLRLKVSGYNGSVWHYLVFDKSSPEAVARTDDNLGRIFDSFKIQQGDLNLQKWKGKVGAAQIKNELDNKENMRAVVQFFIRLKDQDELPAWQEHPAPKATQPASFNPQPLKADEDIPF